MKERIGEVFDGTISAVTGFGIFVALDTIYIEGLIHVSELGADYFQFDNIKHQMLGERTGQRFRLGDRARVKLVRADLETNKIDFTLVRDETTSGSRKSGARGAAKSFAKPLADEPGAKFAKKPLARRGEKPVERSQAKSEGKASAKLAAKPAAKPPVKAAVKKAPVKAKVKAKPAVKRAPKAATKPVVKKAAKKR
jgi:ribonuclease R